MPEAVNMTLIDETLKGELSALYSAPDRFYHNCGHIDALLHLLETHRAEFEDPEAVEAAIWFHDAIYDSREKDNELKSAQLAEDRLRARSIDPERASRICIMIEATATHTVPHLADPGAVADAEKFLDMDLSILGADERSFDEYEALVRRSTPGLTRRAGAKDVARC